jgi:hypothetical protein
MLLKKIKDAIDTLQQMVVVANEKSLLDSEPQL